MKSSHFYLAAISIISFFSCTKNNTDSPAPGERIKRIVSKNSEDSTWYITFNYNTDGRLFMIVDSNSQTHIRNTFIYYDSQNRLLKAEKFYYYGSLSNMLYKTVDSFTYDNNLISKKFGTSTYNPGYRLSHTYSYDSQKRLIADSSYSSLTNKAAFFKKFTYAGNNNLVQLEEFENFNGAWKSNYIEKAAFSSKINPYRTLGAEIYFTFYLEPIEALSKNTPTEITYRDGTKNIYSYEYFNNGLPKKLHELYQSSSPSSNTTDFFYE